MSEAAYGKHQGGHTANKNIVKNVSSFPKQFRLHKHHRKTKMDSKGYFPVEDRSTEERYEGITHIQDVQEYI